LFDYSFTPAKAGGYYYVATEKNDSLWKRKAWFLAQKTLYMEGWYKDDSCKIAHGLFMWFHPNGMLRLKGHFVNGKREGVFLSYHENGLLKDSTTYVKGRKNGIGLGFHENGYPSDSTNFDGNGNGVEIRWHDDGALATAGYWTQDTLKTGRWKYYHRNGNLMATEDYDAKGKLLQCNCFEENGRELDTALCREKEAFIDLKQWRRFLEKNLGAFIEQKAREGISGSFTVVVSFVVNTDGTLADMKALTNYGHGIEEGILRIMKKAPVWVPARSHGRLVKSYHLQPISFEVSNE